MGQPIVVTVKPTADPSRARFEVNRTLTGMSHERYDVGVPVEGDRPPDELARRLFAHGGVRRVHVFSNVINLTLEPGGTPESLVPVIEQLYIHYTPGVQPSVPPG